MKFVAVSRVLNEADIVEAFARHTAYYVDHHIFLDNGSVDGTTEILRNLAADGLPITVYQSSSRSFVEAQALTYMYQRAVLDHAADWVFPLDDDEFIDDRALDIPLRDFMARFGAERPDIPYLSVRLRNYYITPDDAPHSIVPCRMTQAGPITDVTKAIIRGDLLDRGVVIQPGSHSIHLDDGKPATFQLDERLCYAHFPVRSPYQFISKIIVGWSKVLAAGPAVLEAGHAFHYREPFEILRTDPKRFLRNRAMMETLTARSGLVHDPITYRGGELRFSWPVDHEMRCVQVVMQYLHELATQHGQMMELVRKLGDVVNQDESGIWRLV